MSTKQVESAIRDSAAFSDFCDDNGLDLEISNNNQHWHIRDHHMRTFCEWWPSTGAFRMRGAGGFASDANELKQLIVGLLK